MSAQGSYFTEQLVRAIREDLAEAAKHVADVKTARTLCFLEPEDHYVDILLEAGFANIVGYAPTPEAAGNTPEYFQEDPRVTTRIHPADEFFADGQEPFDFMFFTNPMHPEWVANLEELALKVLKPGGHIYFLEPEAAQGIGTHLIKADKMLDTVCSKVSGLFGKKDDTGSDFRKGLSRTTEGVDEMQLLRRLKRNGCRPVFVRYERLAHTPLFRVLGDVINYPQFFRILAAKD